MNRLSARRVITLTSQGYYADGGGLYLRVGDTGAKSWVFRYRRHGRLREMGMGATHAVSLADARQRATEARGLLAKGDDPIEARRAAQAASARVPVFKDAASSYVEGHRAGWKNAKHADQWTNTLETYAYPVLGMIPVDRITTEDLLRVLRPIWGTKTETATRVRQRIESVIDAEYARLHIERPNPARWRGHLAKLLPNPQEVRQVEHFPTLPYSDLPDFMAKLRAQQSISARALEFTILTAARTNMVAPAKWEEISGEDWTVPAERMKGRRAKAQPHTVPLSSAAMKLLNALPRIPEGAYCFPGGRNLQGHLSLGAMDALLERMGYAHITVHGFRSAFKDWCAEETNYPNELSEAALAHVIKDKAEAAYRRGELLKKRRAMMQAWGRYLS